MDKTDPPAKVASNDQLGPVAEASKCPACYGSGVIEEYDDVGLVYQGPCDLCSEPEDV